MAKRTVLRVDSSIDLSDRQLIELAINHGAAPSNLEIRSERLAQSDQSQLFQKRFSSICHGAKFYFAHLVEETSCRLSALRQTTLLSYISQLENNFNESLAAKPLSLIDKQTLLHEHACMLIGAFSSSLGKDTSEMTHWLSKAEEYKILTEPREELMTLTSMTEHGKEYYFLQAANQLPPLSEELLNEYWNIRQNKAPLPLWYQHIEPMERRFLATILKQAKSKSDLPKLFVNFSSRLRTIPGMANFRQHAISILDDRLEPLLQNRRYASSMVSSRDIQKSSIPQAVRDHHTLTNIYHIIEEGLPKLITEKLANTEFNDGDTVNLDFKMALQTLISPKYTELFLPDKKLHDDKIEAADKFTYHKLKTNYSATDKHNKNANIDLIIDLTLRPTNHALNKANKLDYTVRTNAHCSSFVTDAQEFLHQNTTHKNYSEIQALVNQYEQLKQTDDFSQASWRDANKRELYLSSLEQLLTVLQGNLSYGSCVSGKDRKAVELLHTDAMLIYRRLYGTWPTYFDTDNAERARFVNIFCKLYTSHHHHYAAGFNADGSEGIKNIDDYLPADILYNLRALYAQACPNGESSLIADDAFASFNELRSIQKFCYVNDDSYQVKAEAELWLLEKKQNIQHNQERLSLENITKNTYIHEIWRLISELTTASTSDINKFWDEKTQYGINISSAVRLMGVFKKTDKPRGVKRIGHAIKKTAGQLNDAFLAQVHSILKERSHASTLVRDPETEKLYTLLSHLVGQGDSPKKVHDTTNLISIYQGLCELYQKAKGTQPPEITEMDSDSDKEDYEKSETETAEFSLN